MVAVCPAALPVHPPHQGPSVICGVLHRANDGAHIGGFSAKGQVGALISGRTDAGTVRNFCAGQGVPGSPASYCSCRLWRAEKQRIAAARRMGPDGLRDEQAGRQGDSPAAERVITRAREAVAGVEA